MLWQSRPGHDFTLKQLNTTNTIASNSRHTHCSMPSQIYKMPLISSRLKKGAWNALYLKGRRVGVTEVIDDASLDNWGNLIYHLPQRKSWKSPVKADASLRSFYTRCYSRRRWSSSNYRPHRSLQPGNQHLSKMDADSTPSADLNLTQINHF